MKHKDLAAAYGLSIETVRRWPAEKRAALIREIESGVQPEVKRLIGELAQLCYVVQCMQGAACNIEVWKCSFNIYFINDTIVSNAPLNALALQGAIAKLEKLLK